MAQTLYFSASAHAQYQAGYEEGKQERMDGYGYSDPRDWEPELSDDWVLGYEDGWYRRERATLQAEAS